MPQNVVHFLFIYYQFVIVCMKKVYDEINEIY